MTTTTKAGLHNIIDALPEDMTEEQLAFLKLCLTFITDRKFREIDVALKGVELTFRLMTDPDVQRDVAIGRQEAEAGRVVRGRDFLASLGH